MMGDDEIRSAVDGVLRSVDHAPTRSDLILEAAV